MAIRIYDDSNEGVEQALVNAKDEGYSISGLSNGQFEKLYGRKSVSTEEHFQYYVGGRVNVLTNGPGSRLMLCFVRLDKMKSGGWIEFEPATI